MTININAHTGAGFGLTYLNEEDSIMTNKINWQDEDILSQLKELAGKGLSSKDIASVLGTRLGGKINDRSVRRVAQQHDIELKQSNKNGYNTPNTIEKSRHSDGSRSESRFIEMTEAQAMDDDYVLKAHGFDPNKWEIVNVKNGFWQQNSHSNGKINLYQSKISVKPKKNDLTTEQLASILNNNVNHIEIDNIISGSDTLMIPLFDLHFGIETFESLSDKLNQMVERIHKGYKNIAIIIGGDYFHSDFITKTQTVKNTQLDHADNVKALEDGTQFISTLIEESLKSSTHVELHAIGGNHDSDRQYMFMWGIKIKYPQVGFELTDEAREAFSVGKVGVMLAHGDLAVKRLPMLFATEYPEIWAKSTYRTVMTGHFHTEKLNDIDGVVLHQFGTPKKSDPYEKRNGYTMARKHLQLLEFSEERLLATYEIE